MSLLSHLITLMLQKVHIDILKLIHMIWAVFSKHFWRDSTTYVKQIEFRLLFTYSHSTTRTILWQTSSNMFTWCV